MLRSVHKCIILKNVLLALMLAYLIFETPVFGADQPNIVFILADDLGVKDLSNEGSNFYESPNIDRISNMGMKFTRGYAASRVCSPSRAAILTGRYPVNTGITTWIGDRSGIEWRKAKRFDSHLPPDYERKLRDSENTLAEVLLRDGYQTFFAGKWHLGGKDSLPTDHGFLQNVGGWKSGGPKGGYFSPYKNPQLKDGQKGESLPIRLGKETASFIRRNKDKRFFAFLSFYSVHGPIQTSESLWKKYRDKATANKVAAERFKFDRRLSVRQVQDCPIYAGMIESMDDAVGIVLKELDDLGLTQNTIICFTSDNGGVSSGDAFSTSNAPYRGGKGRQWEGGIRSPCYIFAPNTTYPKSTSDVAVSGIDWYPTLLDLVGVSIPNDSSVDGLSLVPLLRGGGDLDRPLFWHFPHYGNQGGEPSSMVIDDGWKLIHYHEDNRYELYNICVDIGERKDLSQLEHIRFNLLKESLARWQKATNARFPTEDNEFIPSKRRERWNKLRTTGKQQLERKHANFLETGFMPNEDWWGSSIK